MHWRFCFFLPRDALHDAVKLRQVVRLSVCDVVVPWSYSSEFFENNHRKIRLVCSLPSGKVVLICSKGTVNCKTLVFIQGKNSRLLGVLTRDSGPGSLWSIAPNNQDRYLLNPLNLLRLHKTLLKTWYSSNPEKFLTKWAWIFLAQ